MSHFAMDDPIEVPMGGRKGKTCSMSGCHNTHQRCPNISFFRFPKELFRAKEWLMICDRPDLLRRVEIGDITINNYYVCEVHFPNQILDYATRKILIKTAKPLSLDELKTLPKRDDKKLKSKRHSSDEYDMHIEQEFDDDIDAGDYEIEDSKDGIKFGHFGVKIAKAEGNYHSDLLEPLDILDEDTYTDAMTRAPYCWTPEATRLLIKLRTERNADFEQSGARKSQIWVEICSKMRESGYDFTPEKVSKKWHNITITYQKNTEKDPESVNWEFFNDMHSVFQNKKMQDPLDSSNDFGDIEPIKHNGTAKRKSNGITGDRITQTPDSDLCMSNVRESLRIKRQRLETNENHIMHADTSVDVIQSHGMDATQSIDENWWKNYFEQKLELERKRMEKEDERHKDRMNFQKMAIMLQERVEKIKIEAMKNLTNALLRLQESGKQ